MIEDEENVSFDFEEELSRVYKEFLYDQERLPPEFEKIWSENIEDLYEN
jgi:hypothetical protein